MKKTAIISGASRGIGKATARKLSVLGYKVALLSRNEKEMNETKQLLEITVDDVLVIPTDLRKEEEVEKSVGAIMKKFGRIDLLVSNAGVGFFHKVESISNLEWDEIMEVNLKGNFLMTKAVVPVMKKQGNGHIIGVASDVSKRGEPTCSAYCASKYGQDGFFHSVRKELRNDGIKVSVVYPGLVDTHFGDRNPGKDDEFSMLRPEDVADAIAYIAGAPPHVVIDELMIHPLGQEY